ncbi:hypothetical protein SKB0092_32470 [Roseomonas mucosa]
MFSASKDSGAVPVPGRGPAVSPAPDTGQLTARPIHPRVSALGRIGAKGNTQGYEGTGCGRAGPGASRASDRIAGQIPAIPGTRRRAVRRIERAGAENTPGKPDGPPGSGYRRFRYSPRVPPACGTSIKDSGKKQKDDLHGVARSDDRCDASKNVDSC